MREVVARGVRFNVLELGHGDPLVVCVHGLLLDNHSSFYMTIAPALARHARVILYDLRGHGRSEQPAEGYGSDDMADDLAALLDALGFGDRPAIIVGHSFGGHIALRFAVRHPARVAGLVLLDAQSGVADIGERMAQTFSLQGEARTAKLEELFGHWLARHSARGHRAAATSSQDGGSTFDADGEATIAFVGRLRRKRRSPLVDTAQRLAEQTSFIRDICATAPLEDVELTQITCPVLAVYGQESELRSDGERLARVLPRCELVLVPGASHGVLFQATGKLRDLLDQWIVRTRQ